MEAIVPDENGDKKNAELEIKYEIPLAELRWSINKWPSLLHLNFVAPIALISTAWHSYCNLMYHIFKSLLRRT